MCVCIYIYMCVCIYIYMCVCVCVCVVQPKLTIPGRATVAKDCLNLYMTKKKNWNISLMLLIKVFIWLLIVGLLCKIWTISFEKEMWKTQEGGLNWVFLPFSNFKTFSQVFLAKQVFISTVWLDGSQEQIVLRLFK